MNDMTGGGDGRRGRDLRPSGKVVRLHPGGPWVWDEGGDPPASPRRGWWALWGLTPVTFFGVHSRDEGREVEKTS